MKIAINTTSAVAGGGITYIKNLLTCLSKININHQYLILTTLAGKEIFYFQHPNFTFVSFKIPSKSSILRILWEQCILPSFLKKEKVDVLFSPGNICPLFTTIPDVVMVQNIEPFSSNFSKRNGLIKKIRLKLLKLLTILSIKKAKKVIFPSTNARIVVEKSGSFMKHAEVIYHGINKEIFHPHIDQTRVSQLKKIYKINKFIFYTSHIQRYKNFLELIKAFVLLHDKIDTDIQLVFAGKCFDREYYHEMNTFIAEHGYENRIVFLGQVPYEELPYLYSACMIFAYPSTCESFGMSLVEAMACGAPVLASQIEPMLEICEDSAVYFNPFDCVNIANTISRVLNDKKLLNTLRERSLKRARYFSWNETAMRTLIALTE